MSKLSFAEFTQTDKVHIAGKLVWSPALLVLQAQVLNCYAYSSLALF